MSDNQSLDHVQLPNSVGEKPPFSPWIGLVVALVVGALPFLLFSAWSARRLGRLGKDLWLYVVAVVGVFAFWTPLHGARLDATAFKASGGTGWDAQWPSIVARVLALAVWGLFFVRQRDSHTVFRAVGAKYGSPWKAAIVATVVGLLFGMAVSTFVLKPFLGG